jgi:hypothetical protein
MGALETSLGSGSAIAGELFRANIRSPESTSPDSGARKLHSSDVKFTSPVMRDDWDLIRQAVLGIPEAQERLFKTHTPKLYRIAFAVLRNREDAEDVVQESWCRAYAASCLFHLANPNRNQFGPHVPPKEERPCGSFFERYSRQSIRTVFRRNSGQATEP